MSRWLAGSCNANSAAGSAAGSAAMEVVLASRKRTPGVLQAEDAYMRNFSKFHDLCYVGRTREARRFLERCSDLWWDTSCSSAVRTNLRALGKYEGHPTYVLDQMLLRAEEMSLMEAAASASTCTLHQ